ncbi:MAG TPA: hypothetical protein VF161_02575 [Steroidobacteraceae bacterium]
MASPVDICKLALGHLGDGTNIESISPPDGTRQAELCAQFYPVARDTLLEFGWSFNTRRAALALLEVPVPDGWLYAYALPASCMKPLEVRSPLSRDDLDTEDFITESLDDSSRVIYTNAPEAQLKFLVRVTDTTRWTPGFIYALSWLLASLLAGPLLKGRAGVAAARDARSHFRQAAAEAHASDANTAQQSGRYKDHKPNWISDR